MHQFRCPSVPVLKTSVESGHTIALHALNCFAYCLHLNISERVARCARLWACSGYYHHETVSLHSISIPDGHFRYAREHIVGSVDGQPHLLASPLPGCNLLKLSSSNQISSQTMSDDHTVLYELVRRDVHMIMSIRLIRSDSSAARSLPRI